MNDTDQLAVDQIISAYETTLHELKEQTIFTIEMQLGVSEEEARNILYDAVGYS